MSARDAYRTFESAVAPPAVTARSRVALPPAVGYQGGKRRLLPRLRPLFPIDMALYVEPYVGMGANYLDLRARGYLGSAVLADTNETVRGFWWLAHHSGGALIDVVRRMNEWPKTRDGYYELLDTACDDPTERVGRFLWICNYGYGNKPPFYEGSRWGNRTGEKFTSAAKWGKTFPWADVISRTEAIVEALAGQPVTILPDARDAFALTSPASHCYADPPYLTPGLARQYGQDERDHVALAETARGFVALSEATDLSGRLDFWSETTGDVTARISGGTGAAGARREYLYCRRAA